MSYGLRVYDEKGEVILDISDRITRHIYTSAQTASSGNSGTLTELQGAREAVFSLPVNRPTSGTGWFWKLPHTVYRSGNAMYWTAQSYGNFDPWTAVNFCFIYT